MNWLESIFGPILGWEMVTLVRRSRYHWLRGLFAVLLFLVLWSAYSETAAYMSNRGQVDVLSAFANSFFLRFSFVELLAVLLLTPAYVATSIAVEKQRRTIEYLFATDLRNREIVLGKWLARSLNVLMVLFVGLPIVGIAQLLGGIDPNLQLIVVLMCASCTASTAALAIYISVHSNEVRRALGNTYSALLLILLSPFFYYVGIALLEEFSKSVLNRPGLTEEINAWVDWIGLRYAVETAHPIIFYFKVIESSGQSRSGATPDLLERSLVLAGVHAVLTVLLLAVSILQLRRAWLKTESGPKRSLTTRFKELTLFKRRTVRTVGDLPMLWKEWHFGEQRKVGCASRMLMAAGIIAFYFPLLEMVYSTTIGGRNNRMWGPEGINIYLRSSGVVLLALAYGKTAIRAASSIGVERDRDCWISLLSTPLTASDVVMGKFFGSLRPFVLAIVVMTPIWLMAVFAGAMSALAVPCILIVSTVFAVFVAGLGIHESIKRATTGKAIGFTVAICVLLSGLGHSLGGILMIPFMFFNVGGETIGALYYTSIPWVPIVGSMFRDSEFGNLGGRFLGTAIPCVIFWLAVYLAVGLGLVRRAIRQFHRATGRMEDEDPGSRNAGKPPIPTAD